MAPIALRQLLVPAQIGGGYDGAIDDVRIYRRALAPDEIQSLCATLPALAPPRMSATIGAADGKIHLLLTGERGRNYRIEVSPDLLIWNPILTNVAADGTLQLIDSPAGNFNGRFYRGAVR